MKKALVFLVGVVAVSAFSLFAEADLLGRVDVNLLVLVTNSIAQTYEGFIPVVRCRRVRVRLEPATEFLGLEVSSRCRAKCSPDDRCLAYVIAPVLVVRHVLEYVVDELAQRKRPAVSKLRKLAARCSVRFPDLIQLDRVRLASNLFTMPLTGRD